MIDNTWVLHCIDYLTRFSAAHVLKNKSAEEIIEEFSLIWISVFGPPENILSDNGCEFSNPKMQNLCCSFNITQKFTAAEAPFSNGICERHNALIGKMTTKVVNDQKCRLNIALLWAIHAKNSLLNKYRFSPYQLVFGHNPNIPGNSNNRLPALSTPNDDIVREHLNCLHKARSAYIEAENSNRIRRALAGKLFTGTYQKFCPDDKVYYKRLGKNGWQGPGIVLAQNGTEIIIKTGASSLIKVHPCKAILKEEADKQLNATKPTASLQSKTQNVTVIEGKNNEPETVEEISEDEDEDTDNTGRLQIQNNIGKCLQNSLPTNSCSSVNNEENTAKLLKVGDMIKYKDRPNEEYKLATIISRAGKASGKYSNWYNIQNASSNIKEAKDLGAIEWQTYENQDSDVEQFVNQQTQEALVLTSIEKNDIRYDIAKQKEIDEWTHFKVYEEVNRNEYPEDEILSCRWVTEKKNNPMEAFNTKPA